MKGRKYFVRLNGLERIYALADHLELFLKPPEKNLHSKYHVRLLDLSLAAFRDLYRSAVEADLSCQVTSSNG